MNFEEVLKKLDEGKKVKLPEWQGHWFKKDGNILVESRTGEILNTPFMEDYKNRTDWEETNGLRDFGGALTALKAGRKIARQGWNGKGMFVFMRPEDELSVDMIVNKVKSLPDSVKKFFTAKCAWHEKESRTKVSPENIKVKFTAYLCMYAADGSIVNGWLASQTDILAEDWQIVE